MMAYLRLIRLPNLFMIALTMFLVRFCIILPAYQVEFNFTGNHPEQLSRIQFVILVTSTLLVAAAGYVINDVFDVTADAINKPGRNLFEKRLSRHSGQLIFTMLSLLGSVGGLIVGMQIGKFSIALLHVFSAFSLWMYASYFKRRLLSGNLLIAALSGLAVLLPGLFEPSFYSNFDKLLPFGEFAFLVSLAREIIKDAEDVDGDERMQCKTMPIRYGFKVTKLLTIILLTVTAISIGWRLHEWFSTSHFVSWWNLALVFTLPLIGLSYLVATAERPADYHFASIFAKAYLLMGILSIFPFWYYILR